MGPCRRSGTVDRLALVFGGVSGGLQAWIIETALHVVEAASVRWVAVFDLAVGLGVLTGGIIGDSIAGFGGSVAGLGLAVARVAIVI